MAASVAAVDRINLYKVSRSTLPTQVGEVCRLQSLPCAVVLIGASPDVLTSCVSRGAEPCPQGLSGSTRRLKTVASNYFNLDMIASKMAEWYVGAISAEQAVVRWWSNFGGELRVAERHSWQATRVAKQHLGVALALGKPLSRHAFFADRLASCVVVLSRRAACSSSRHVCWPGL